MHFDRNLDFFFGPFKNVKADERIQLCQGDVHKKMTTEKLKLGFPVIIHEQATAVPSLLLIQHITNNIRQTARSDICLFVFFTGYCNCVG